MKLTINNPRIENNRLYSLIEYNNTSYDMYFEVEKEYISYLCDEVCDAFLVSLIPFIVKNNFDVEIKGKISSKLFYQLQEYLLPLLCSEFEKKPISINCELTDISFDSKGVGASVSCGVDSFYTMLRHKNCKDESYNITHLTFFNAGSHGDNGGDEARKKFHERLTIIKDFCEKNSYNLVTVDTNMNELMKMEHKKTHSFRTLGCVLALQKLFGKYYFASGYHYNDMKLDETASAHYDTLNVQCLSNETLTIYSSGIEVSRLEKVKFISNFEITYNWLNVCVSTAENCGTCIKCTRTSAELDALGKIELYKAVLDLKIYKKNRIKILTEILKESRRKRGCDAIYAKEIIEEFKKNKRKIPFLSKLLSYIPGKSDIKYILKTILKPSTISKIKGRNDGWMN